MHFNSQFEGIVHHSEEGIEGSKQKDFGLSTSMLTSDFISPVGGNKVQVLKF